MRGFVLSGVLVGVLGGLGGSARAAELMASGPPECADAAELSFRVERSIGMPLARAAPLRFDVEMERAAPGYVARIRVAAGGDAADQQRELTAPDCARLADAVGVAVALALGAAEGGAAEPGARGAGEEPGGSDAEPASEGAGAEVVTAGPASRADAGAALPSPVAPGLEPSLSVWLLADAGSLPSPGVGVGLGAEIGWRRLQLRLLGTSLFEQQTRVDSALAPGAGARLDLLAASLLGCTPLFGDLRSRITSLACLGVELGRLAGVGTGVASPREGSALWAAPQVQLVGLWSIPGSPLRLGVTLLGAAPLNRDEFALSGIGTVHRPPNVVGRLSVGLGVGFD